MAGKRRTIARKKKGKKRKMSRREKDLARAKRRMRDPKFLARLEKIRDRLRPGIQEMLDSLEKSQHLTAADFTLRVY